MADIKRKAVGEETLRITDCPCCGGSIEIGDCGYTTFNPGWAKCEGECKREWKFSCVDNRWDAGQRWNSLAKKITRKLLVFSLLSVTKYEGTSRDFDLEEMESQAATMLNELKQSIMGGR